MTTYTDEVNVYNPEAIASGIADAGDTADKYITAVDQNGIKVHAVSNTETNYAQINANGMDIVKGGNSIANFGDTVRVGKSNSSRFLMNASSLQAYNSSNTKYFEVSSSGLTWGTNTAATTTQVNEAAKRTYVSIRATAVDFNADTATLQATLYVDGAAKTSSVTYAWLKDGSAMSGETARTLSVTTAKGGLEHAYSCTVTY